MKETPLPLDGVRVLDIATVIGGPGVATRLGDFGADVIKVEHPQRGDTTRELGWKVGGVTLWWKHVSRNKRPVTLKLSDPRGRDLLLRLVETADVLVESFRPGTLERWDLGPEVLLERTPGLVVCRVSGFGQTGPDRARPAFGTTAEAMSGLAHMTGESDGPPLLPPIAISDELAAVLGAYAVMVALYHRDARGGAGQVIDLSLVEGLFGILGPLAAVHESLGQSVDRMGSRIPYAGPRGVYRASDGWVALSGTAHPVALRVFDAIGRPELKEDPRFATNDARVENADALDAVIGEWMATRTAAEALEILGRAEAAAAPVLDVPGFLADAHFRDRGIVVRVPDDEMGHVALPEVHPRLSATPGHIRHPGLPLGTANDEIYRGELGLTEEELEELRSDGVI